LDISDATLFDWVDLSAMLAWIVEISGAPEEQLKQEIAPFIVSTAHLSTRSSSRNYRP
jgi:hypothetical protein